jgi:DNA-binding transcriptional LysR family regulator
MTYDQLLTLHTIVTEGTFRAAAEKLNKSQSALSHMIKKLEDTIDLKLLSRAEYRPKLTPEGEVFYRQALRVIQQMQQLDGQVRSLNTTQEAQVFLAVTATYPLKPLLAVIGDIRSQYPATHIRLSRESMGGTIERLFDEDANMIIATMDGVPTEQVEAVPFSKITIIPVAHKDFEPARSSHMKTLNEMQSYTQIVVADSSSGKYEQSRDIMPGSFQWTVSDFAAKKEILLSKMGWGGLPEHLIRDELASGELVPLNIENFPPRHSLLYLIRKRDANVGIVARSIWQQLLDISSRVPFTSS